MCHLQLLIYSAPEPMEVGLDCAYQQVAVEWVDKLAKRTAWPAVEVHKLDFWPGEPAFVLHLANVWGARVEPCALYHAMKRAKAELDETDVIETVPQ